MKDTAVLTAVRRESLDEIYRAAIQKDWTLAVP